jgi:hypothetical protein
MANLKGGKNYYYKKSKKESLMKKMISFIKILKEKQRMK